MNETQAQQLIDLLSRLVVAAEKIAASRPDRESNSDATKPETYKTNPSSQLGDERDLNTEVA